MNAEELIHKLLAYPGRGSSTFDAFSRLDALLGHPHRSFRIVHVGGTNGKGSVSWKIAEALRIEGFRVGLYTSPHISSVCERIQINGEEIPPSAIARHLPRVFHFAKEDLSFFDLLTVLAFLYFQHEQVDWAVVEVGLGGRFDATNVIDPNLSIITSIGFDHMELLGSSLDLIAKEKGGIIRPNVPLITGPSAFPFFPFSNSPNTSFHPFYDEENRQIARLALKLLGVSEKAIEKGIAIRPPCRFEQIGDTIFDVAHNEDGFIKLVSALQWHFPNEKFDVIAGFSPTKDWESCLDRIRPVAEKIYLVAPHPRLLPLGDLSLEEAFQMSKRRKVVCGSFYLMAEAKRCLHQQFAFEAIRG